MTHKRRTQLAALSLKGISIGDAFGDSFFGETQQVLHHIQKRTIPLTKWEYTDDTVMAIAVFEQLEKNGEIDQNELAKCFSKNYYLDEMRGYGATVRRILRGIQEGKRWQNLSKSVFDGMGSMGNGAAMRVSPIGAYWFDDVFKVKKLARKSAEVTHVNEEGITGAIAVAVATALITQYKINDRRIEPKVFLEQIANELPETDTKYKIKKAATIPVHYHIETLKTILGNGVKMLAQDTVPFALWCVAHYFGRFEEALWKGVAALGDRDTICAIIGGVIILSMDEKQLPISWLNNVEKINGSIFRCDDYSSLKHFTFEF